MVNARARKFEEVMIKTNLNKKLTQEDYCEIVDSIVCLTDRETVIDKSVDLLDKLIQDKNIDLVFDFLDNKCTSNKNKIMERFLISMVHHHKKISDKEDEEFFDSIADKYNAYIKKFQYRIINACVTFENLNFFNKIKKYLEPADIYPTDLSQAFSIYNVRVTGLKSADNQKQLNTIKEAIEDIDSINLAIVEFGGESLKNKIINSDNLNKEFSNYLKNVLCRVQRRQILNELDENLNNSKNLKRKVL